MVTGRLCVLQPWVGPQPRRLGHLQGGCRGHRDGAREKGWRVWKWSQQKVRVRREAERLPLLLLEEQSWSIICPRRGLHGRSLEHGDPGGAACALSSAQVVVPADDASIGG